MVPSCSRPSSADLWLTKCLMFSPPPAAELWPFPADAARGGAGLEVCQPSRRLKHAEAAGGHSALELGLTSLAWAPGSRQQGLPRREGSSPHVVFGGAV